MNHSKLPVVVLISGGGSNLQALIDGVASGFLPIELRGVISNEPNVFGLQRAEQAGIPTRILHHRHFATRAAYDAKLQALIDSFTPDLVVLAGFMRILTPELVAHYHGRMLNIHPSLLPKYPGLHTHTRVLAAGDPEHGASVHFVTAALDSGPVILQVRIPILADDNATTLAARVLLHEHRIYPQVVRWFAEARLRLLPCGIMFDGGVLATPIQWTGDSIST